MNEELGTVADFIDRLGLPLVIIIVLLVCVWRIVPTLKKYIEIVMEQKVERAKRDGEMNELMRLSNSVINNNTETLKIVNQYNKQAEDLIQKHDVDSAERQRRVEERVDTVLNDLDNVITDLKIIKQK